MQMSEGLHVAKLPVPTPNDLVAQGIPVGAVITWRPYGDQAATVTGYNLYRASAGSQDFTKLNSTPLTPTSYTDTADGGHNPPVLPTTQEGSA